MFQVLGWDFSDFNSVKSELRHKDYKDSVDYAFFSSTDKNKPILLLEAKALGTDLNNPKIVKQLCIYLGEMGVQWGVLSDGNKYVMYNSRGGHSFEDQRFLTLQIKSVGTEDGLLIDELSEKLMALLSRECLENDKIQKTYEEHMINGQIQTALYSLLSSPFDTLAAAIRKEFKEERVKANPDLKITTKRIIQYLADLADEEGKLPIDFESSSLQSDEEILCSVGEAVEKSHDSGGLSMSAPSGRARIVSISDLLQDGLVHEGDNWKFEYKGDVFWGRITGNGELEVNGKMMSNPSQAGTAIMGKPSAGWRVWFYKNDEEVWRPVDYLRQEYREKHGIVAIRRKKRTQEPAIA